MSSRGTHCLVSISNDSVGALLGRARGLSTCTGNNRVAGRLVSGLTIHYLRTGIFSLSGTIIHNSCRGTCSILSSLFTTGRRPISILTIVSGYFISVCHIGYTGATNFSYASINGCCGCGNERFTLEGTVHSYSSLSIGRLHSSLSIVVRTSSTLGDANTTPHLILRRTLIGLLLVSGRIHCSWSWQNHCH